MSIQPDALDRSVLESKKLDELQAIAAAIGAKAGSRARKAQVVDAILATAGVDAAQPATGPSEAVPADAAGAGSSSGSAEAKSGGRKPDSARPSFSADPWADAADEKERFRQRAARRAEGANGSTSETDTSGGSDATAPTGDGSASSDGGGRSDDAKPSQDAKQSDATTEAKQSEPSEAEQSKAEQSNGPSDAKQSDDATSSAQGKAEGNADGKASRPNDGNDKSRGGGGGDGNRGGNDRSGGDRNRNRNDGNGGDRNRNRNDGNRGGDRNNDRGGDDGEPGNRRRRRRGRDREREQNDEPAGDPIEVSGLLDLRDEGYGFLRTKGFLPSRDDVYVSAKQVRQSGLRKGDLLTGLSRPANRNEKNPGLLRLDLVNGLEPEEASKRPRFEDLTPLFPDEKLQLERPDDPGDMTARIVDLISPIGKGQRGLIVSPPKAGKTTIMKTIATAIEANNPEVELIVLLVDERPEEVTDMRRTVRGDVVSSTFDRPSDEHTQVAELTIERAKRMVETGKDVVIILDGITRLARAYNLAAPATGRILSGGVDSGALYPPKRFFGAARNLEEGGSLTILATALIETGSKMDEVIFEEFKGTGNMELRLDRRLAERRIYPAIDVDASSTRQEQLLFDRRQFPQVMKLRRVLSGLAGDGEGRPGAGLELMVDRLKTFRSNDEFLSEIAKAPSGV